MKVKTNSVCVITLISVAVFLCSMIFLNISYFQETTPKNRREIFKCSPTIHDETRKESKLNLLEKITKDLQNKYQSYENLSHNIHQLKIILEEIKNFINSDEIREKISDKHVEGFLIIVRSYARESYNSLIILNERHSTESISVHLKHLVMAVKEKKLKMTESKINDILSFLNLFKNEVNKTMTNIHNLSKNAQNDMIVQGDFNFGDLKYWLRIFLLGMLFWFLSGHEIKKYILMIAILLLLIIYFIPSQNFFSKINQVHKHIGESETLIHKIYLENEEFICEAERMKLFLNGIFRDLRSQQNIVPKIISKISEEVSKTTEFGKIRAKTLIEGKINTLEAYTPKDIDQPEMIEAVNNLKAFMSHVIFETTNYFTKVRSISERTVDYVDQLKSIVEEKRIFNFKKFLDYLIDIYIKNIEEVNPLVENLSDQINLIDNIMVIAEKAKREKIEKEELTIMYKRLAVGGAGLLIGGAGFLIGGFNLYTTFFVTGSGYGLSDLWIKNNKVIIDELKERFQKFFGNLKNLQEFLNENRQNLELTKNELISIKENALGVSRDVETLMDDLNEEYVMTNVVLGDNLEVQVVIDGLELIMKENLRLIQISREIINNQFTVNNLKNK